MVMSKCWIVANVRMRTCLIVLSFAISVFFLSSCGHKEIQDYCWQIRVESSDEKIKSEWLDSMKATVTEIPLSMPIASIWSMDVFGRKCFLIDSFMQIFCLDLERKQAIRSNISLGNANNEMISPVCLSADGEYVYVYDSMKGRIFVLTHELRLHHVLNTECSFSMLRKTDDGFACLSIDDGQNFYFLNNEGIVVYSRKLSNVCPRVIPDENPLQIGGDGKLYVKAIYSDVLYRWEDGDLAVAGKFRCGTHERVGEDTANANMIRSQGMYMEGYFVTRSHILSSYVESDGKSIRNNLYDLRTCESISGRLGSIGGIFFRANVQRGKYAYAIVLSEDAFAYGLKGTTENCVEIIQYEFP